MATAQSLTNGAARSSRRCGRGRHVVRAAAAPSVIAPPKEATTVEEMSVNAIRFLSIDGVEKANSGHPGLPMGCAPMAYVLFRDVMKYNPKNPQWFNRDKFVLSAGHGSMLQYSMLHLCGYDSVSVRAAPAAATRRAASCSAARASRRGCCG